MKSNLYIHYENELKKVEKEIEELWKVGKESASKYDKKRQLEYVLLGMQSDKTIKELRQKIDKAIEYIKKHSNCSGYFEDEKMIIDNIESIDGGYELLEILGDKE